MRNSSKPPTPDSSWVSYQTRGGLVFRRGDVEIHCLESGRTERFRGGELESVQDGPLTLDIATDDAGRRYLIRSEELPDGECKTFTIPPTPLKPEGGTS